MLKPIDRKNSLKLIGENQNDLSSQNHHLTGST